MTGFDPTAPERDTSDDEPATFEDNVVPPEALTEDGPTEDTPTDDGSGGPGSGEAEGGTPDTAMTHGSAPQPPGNS